MCVVLKVPRRNIKTLEDMDPNEILTPSLECQTSGPNFIIVHSSIQFVFGDIERSIPRVESAVRILEDRKGCSDLIGTFYMPSRIFLNYEPKRVKIGLHFHTCPFTIASLKLGMSLTIYATTLTDTEHLLLVHASERLGNVGELDRLRAITSVPKCKKKNATEVWITVGFDKSASTLTIRHDITAPNAQKSSSNLVSVTNLTIKTVTVSDSVLEMNFDGYKHLFINPFPVHGSQSQTRIARKPSYIEVCDRIRSYRVSLT